MAVAPITAIRTPGVAASGSSSPLSSVQVEERPFAELNGWCPLFHGATQLRHILVRVVWLRVTVRLLPPWQVRSFAGQLLVRDQRQKMGNRVEPGALLVVRPHHMPRRPGRVSRLEHIVAGAGIV